MKKADQASRLTTHVLDTMNGIPAAGISIVLVRLEGDEETRLVEQTTNDDGRCDAPLLEGDAFAAGTYELRFDVRSYFSRVSPGHPATFYSMVPVRFSVTENPGHLHVPLLISPFSYSTYRGS
ncbi:MAG: hydroxyisourate hydrolase [Leifsonia xyli]|jgi:5-hydroxyisourate hydrolase|nr:MAG: hydroxyisourate hydrolase [Leifsonia xyli]